MDAKQTWDVIATAVREKQPAAVYVSPDLYFEQVEWMQGINSAYVSTQPEHPRMPWYAIEGVPVVMDPNFEGKRFALCSSRDFIDDMRLALDIHTEGMVESEYDLSTEDDDDTSAG